MRNKQQGFTLIELMIGAGGIAAVGIVIAAVYGWIMNIVAIAAADFSTLTGLLILRVIGIVVAPLGAVLGFI